MGSGASSGVAAAVGAASPEDLQQSLAMLPADARAKLLAALGDATKADSGVKVFGMPVSQNVMGPVLMAIETGRGGLEMCNIMEGDQMKPEFLAMNPFHHIPAMKDGAVGIGESSAILHYLAMKYKPEYYPTSEPEVCAVIDFAMASFASEVYKQHAKTVYFVFGFAGAPEDQEAANKAYLEALSTWTTHFLKGKFVCGDKLSIADFKAVPFLIAAMQPAVASKIGLAVPDRARQYVDDFCAAVPSSGMLKEAGGYGIVEFLKSKDPDAKAAADYAKAEYQSSPTPASSGEVKVFGMPPSSNVMGPVMLAMETGKGGLEMCNIMEGEQMKPEFLAMNPYHHVPTMRDGALAVGESDAILHYLATKYKPEYYPTSEPETCAVIDFAMDAFANEVYTQHVKTVYVVFGFASAPDDQAAANKAFLEALDTWTTHFLTGKFVCGDKLSIADFKAVPFLIAAVQPVVASKIGLTVPERVSKYVDDFCAAVPSSKMLKEAGGHSIVEFLAGKA